MSGIDEQKLFVLCYSEYVESIGDYISHYLGIRASTRYNAMYKALTIISYNNKIYGCPELEDENDTFKFMGLIDTSFEDGSFVISNSTIEFMMLELRKSDDA